MRNCSAIYLSIIAFIMNFLCFWYADTLFDRFFVWAFIPFAIAIGVLIASTVFSVALGVRHKMRGSSYIALIISAIAIIVIFAFPFRMAKVRFELPLLEKDRMEVIEMIGNGELVADRIGNIQLPGKYQRNSSDGTVFVYQNDEEQVIAFWVFRGMLSGSVQLIYSSQGEWLIYENETAHPITSVVRLDKHWYLIETDY